MMEKVNNITTTNSTLLFSSNVTFSLTQQSLNGWFSFCVILSVGGSSLLCLLLTTSFYQPHLYRGSKILITHLMLIQLIQCAILFPILNLNAYTTLSPTQTTHSTLDCSITMFLYIGTTLTENWASFLLSVNRYVAIMLPHHYRKWVTRRVLISMMVIPWVMGLGSTLPIYFGVGNLMIAAPPFGFCTMIPSRIYPLYGRVIWGVVGSYFPFAMMGVVYLVLFIRLAKGRYCERHPGHHRIVPSLNIPVPPITLTAKSKRAKQIAMAKMLMVYYLWFCICYLPGPIIVSAYPILFVRYPVVQLWVVKLLLLAGFAASPVIFLVLSSEYQTAVGLLFRKVFPRHTEVVTNVNATSNNNKHNERTDASTKE